MNNINIEIGKRIQEIRTSKGLSRMQLSKIIGVSHQQLQKYEKGTNRISAEMLIMIADALETSVAYFISFTNDHVKISTEAQRLCLEVTRNFMSIQANQQRAISKLLKSLVI